MASKQNTIVARNSLQSSVQIGTLAMLSLGVLIMAIDLGRKDQLLKQIQADTESLKLICSDLVKAQVRTVANNENMTKELAMLAGRLDRIGK